MVIETPVTIRNKRGNWGEIEGRAFADTLTVASEETDGGVQTLTLTVDRDDPEDMLGSSLEDLEDAERTEDNAS